MTKYNKSEIMKAAWTNLRESNAQKKVYRDRQVALFGEKRARTMMPQLFVEVTMAEALRTAWAAAKFNARYTDEQRLFDLRMKDRWNESDFDYARQLERQIAAKAA